MQNTRELPTAACTHVSLLEYNGYFTKFFRCGTHSNLPATGMQNCLILQAIIRAICRRKPYQSQVKIPAKANQKTAIAGQRTCNRRSKHLQSQAKNTDNCTQKYPKVQAKIPVIARKNTRNCRQKYLQFQAICTAGNFTCKLQVS